MPGIEAGTIIAPKPVTVSGSAGQTLNAGSFSYANTTATAQQIGTVVIAASNPSALASLTVTVSGSTQSASVAPVATSNTIAFSPPILVNPGAIVTFTITVKSANSVAAIARRFAYAAMVELGGDRREGGPLTPLGEGLLLMGLVLLPLGTRTRRRAALMTLVGLALAIALASCGNSSGGSSGPSSLTATVLGSGSLSSVVPLSTVSVSQTSGTAVSVQQLTALGFK